LNKFSANQQKFFASFFLRCHRAGPHVALSSFRAGKKFGEISSSMLSARDTFHLQLEELEIGKKHGPEAVVLYQRRRET
jgi:hypothetical protein